MAFQQIPNPTTTLDELRERVPNLHPYAALTLTNETMLLRGEISTEQYLKWASALYRVHHDSLFSVN